MSLKRPIIALADFHKWAIAIAISLGYSQAELNDAYAEKVRIQVDEALNADSIALAIMHFAEDLVKDTVTQTLDGERRDYWSGEPSELWDLIKRLFTDEEKRSKNFPKNVSAFTRRMNMASPALHFVGIEVGVYRTMLFVNSLLIQ